MDNKNNAILNIIIGAAGLLLMWLCGPIFGTVLLTAAGGILCYRTKRPFFYPLIAFAFNFIRSIITVVRYRISFSRFDSIIDFAEWEWIADAFADMGEWAITTIMAFSLVIGSALILLIMVICNVIVKHCSEKK